MFVKPSSALMLAATPWIRRYYPFLNLALFKVSWLLLVVWQGSGVAPALVMLVVSIGLHRSPRAAITTAACIAAAART